MSKALGVGVRVYVKWSKDASPRCVCETGVITDGPYPPGTRIDVYQPLPSTYWGLELDNGESTYTAEYLLTPIDDSDPDTTTLPVEEETTV